MLLAQLSVMEEKNCGLRSKLLSSYLLTSSMISRASMLLAIKWYLADRFLFRTMEVSIGRVARLRKKKNKPTTITKQDIHAIFGTYLQ